MSAFDAYESARELAGFFDSGRVTMCFLDRELIARVGPAAPRAASEGLIDPSLVALYGGQHLQHWPNHDNHVHVRVSETDYAARTLEAVPFEAP